MSETLVGLLSVGGMLVLLICAVPVGIVLGIVGVAGMYFGLSPSFAFGQLRSLPFAVSSNYAFAILPLFILMGIVAERSGITIKLFDAANAWLRSVKGGLYQVVIVGSAMFAAISGSTMVNAIVFTRMAHPEMQRYGYSRSLSLGCIAAAGSFAAMIPPSATMVIYAIMTEQSVGQLLLAGVVPGIISALAYALGIMAMVRIWPNLAPNALQKMPLRQRMTALTWVWPIALLFLLVMGGIYGGFFPPSAAGAVGATGAILIGILYKRGDLFSWLPVSLREAAYISCTIFVILIGGLLFSRMLVAAGIIPEIVSYFRAFDLGPVGFLIGVSILLLVLGALLDTTSMLVVTLPFLFPISQEVGVNPVWFGIIVVKLIEISVITPPIGLNLFAVQSAAGPQASFGTIVRGVIPFIGIELVVLAALITFPALSLWLPSAL
ncbi:TRAP transporter large permease [Paracoccus acridae]|uniref:TRAP transporter large permease n=1 Tax=Paracoccus acridae TaxID=1795310 RepID=UPI001E4CDE75|nr:TRAP transporter large permease subunit [Paracoccus acridae]